jgi:hypothetical protein
MMQDMTKPPSGNADKDFTMMMIPHEIAQLRKWQAANPLERLAATRFPHAFPLDERERSGCQGS